MKKLMYSFVILSFFLQPLISQEIEQSNDLVNSNVISTNIDSQNTNSGFAQKIKDILSKLKSKFSRSNSKTADSDGNAQPDTEDQNLTPVENQAEKLGTESEQSLESISDQESKIDTPITKPSGFKQKLKDLLLKLKLIKNPEKKDDSEEEEEEEIISNPEAQEEFYQALLKKDIDLLKKSIEAGANINAPKPGTQVPIAPIVTILNSLLAFNIWEIVAVESVALGLISLISIILTKKGTMLLAPGIGITTITGLLAVLTGISSYKLKKEMIKNKEIAEILLSNPKIKINIYTRNLLDFLYNFKIINLDKSLINKQFLESYQETLYPAVNAIDIELVKKLIKDGVDINGVDPYTKKTALKIILEKIKDNSKFSKRTLWILPTLTFAIFYFLFIIVVLKGYTKFGTTGYGNWQGASFLDKLFHDNFIMDYLLPGSLCTIIWQISAKMSYSLRTRLSKEKELANLILSNEKLQIKPKEKELLASLEDQKLATPNKKEPLMNYKNSINENSAKDALYALVDKKILPGNQGNLFRGIETLDPNLVKKALIDGADVNMVNPITNKTAIDTILYQIKIHSLAINKKYKLPISIGTLTSTLALPTLWLAASSLLLLGVKNGPKVNIMNMFDLSIYPTITVTMVSLFALNAIAAKKLLPTYLKLREIVTILLADPNLKISTKTRKLLEIAEM